MNDSAKVDRAPVQYVLVRKDLPIWVQVVFVAHAARESCTTLDHIRDDRTILRVLHVESEQELQEFDAQLYNKGFSKKMIRENDEPYNGQALSLGVTPRTDRISALSKLFFHLNRAGHDE